MAQTKWQKVYGIRRTLANKLERQARLIREGRLDQYVVEYDKTESWAREKMYQLDGNA